MARPLRIKFHGAFYHVTSRGNERKAVFKSKRDREKFLEYLESATLRYDARIHAYCLVDNTIYVELHINSDLKSQHSSTRPNQSASWLQRATESNGGGHV